MRILRVLLLHLSFTPLLTAQEFFVEKVGGFERFTTGSFVDLDSDGLEDFAYLKSGRGSVHVLYGQPEGGFAAQSQSLLTGAEQALEIIDFNGDGRPDIAAGGFGVSIAWNLGNRTFETQVVEASRGTFYLQAVDVNLDGQLDLLSTDRNIIGRITWFDLQPGGAEAHHLPTRYNRPFAAVAGNLDDDDRLEIVVSTAEGYFLLDWDSSLSPPNGTYGAPIPLMEGSEDGRHVVLVDLDNDGRLDIATAIKLHDGASRVLWLQNDGNLSFTIKPLSEDPDPTAGYFRWIQATDLDGDQDPDLVVSRWTFGAPSRGRFSMFLNDGSGNFSETRFSPLGVGWQMYSFAIWRYHQDGRMAILPGRVEGELATLNGWPVISLEPEELQANVELTNGNLKITWESNPDHVYRLQFSSDLDSWSDSYLSGGTSISVDSIVGNGEEITHILAPPDSPNLNFRVIGVQQQAD